MLVKKVSQIDVYKRALLDLKTAEQRIIKKIRADAEKFDREKHEQNPIL